jgi:hypothetical protein
LAGKGLAGKKTWLLPSCSIRDTDGARNVSRFFAVLFDLLNSELAANKSPQGNSYKKLFFVIILPLDKAKNLKSLYF